MTKKSEELKTELYEKFHEEYRFTPEQLFWAEIGFDKTAKNQYDAGGNLPLAYMSEKLLPTLMNIMKKYGPIEEDTVRKLLDDLEYTPEKHWARSPLVGVRIRNKRRYTPILPSMFIHGSVSLAWLESFKKSRKGSRLQGMINKDWGSHFEKYVRAILRNNHCNLRVNPGCLKIKKKRFPDIIDCTTNQHPEIDVVAQSETNVYLISCKAMDESTSSKIILNFYLHDYSSFKNSIELDMKYAGQISDIARCVRNSSSFIEDRGFVGKRIIPLLVTSDHRPLSMESVRQWSLDMRIIHIFPETRIIQASALKNIVLE